MDTKIREHRTYSLFDKQCFEEHTEGLKLAHCMKSSSSEQTSEERALETLSRFEDLCVSDKLYCSFCNTSFVDQSQQRSHYKLDWHRYNLKRHLKGQKPVTEENFDSLACDDDVSSISGSESESEDEFVPSSSSEVEDHFLKPKSKKSSVFISRHTKAFFENANGKIISFYRCLLHSKKTVPEKEEQLVTLAVESITKDTWIIFMLGGGHFAAAVFQGNEVIAHKTFHSYTVRAKQGGAQSIRDGRNASSHPKSAGASLRRYNEASFSQHVSELVTSWNAYLSSSHIIAIRAVGLNRNILFGGRNPLLDKDDNRIRYIPFPTRRATFNEVQRVHRILTSLEVYGSASSFLDIPPLTPSKKLKTVAEKPSGSEEMNGSIVDDFGNECSEIQKNLESSPHKFKGRCEGSPRSRGKKKSSPLIDRSKERKELDRPLPKIINQLASQISPESSDTESDEILIESMEISFIDDLEEFKDTVPKEVKEIIRDPKKRKKRKKAERKREKSPINEALLDLRNKLLTSCVEGDLEVLQQTLFKVINVDSVSESKESEPDRIPSQGTVSSEDLVMCINEKVEDAGNSLLHIASMKGYTEIVRLLMEFGSDPNVMNDCGKKPYTVSMNHNTRCAFRRFMCDFPDKYNYSKAGIPGPLTDEKEQEMREKKKEARKIKKQKEQQKKKEKREKKAEDEEKERFLNLSDREKRALAAERRILQLSGKCSEKIVLSRCYFCAEDISGKVPFEYETFRFCSINCLKGHRSKNKGQQL